MESIATRILEVVKKAGINKSEFARKIGVTPAYISKLAKYPDSVPSDRTISDICREFNVSEEWLRTGKGETFIQLSRSETIAKFAGGLMKEEDDSFKKRLIEALAQLSESEWAVLEGIAEKLVQKKD